MTGSVRAYRNSATEGASQIDILLACYDALSEDIRFAGQKAAKGYLADRCRHSQRALLLIGHLESWVSLLDDPYLGASLTAFYQYVRSEILRLQVSTECDDYRKLALMVCETRAAWQNKQSALLSQSERATKDSTYSLAEPDGTTARFLASV